MSKTNTVLPEDKMLGYETGKPWGNITLWCTDYNVFKAIKDLWEKEFEKSLTPRKE